MKFIDTLLNKSSYHQDHNKEHGIYKVLFATFVSVLVSMIIATVFYLKSFGFVLPADVYSDYANQAIDQYPSDLVVSIKDGRIYKNIKDKVNIGNIPKDIESSNHRNKDAFKDVLYFIQIDETKTASLESLKDSQSMAFVGSDGVALYQSDGSVKILPASSIPNYDINQSSLYMLSSEFQTYIPLIISCIFMLWILFGTLFLFVGYLICNALLALVFKYSKVLKYFKIIKGDISYGEAFRFTNYASVPAIIIASIIDATLLYIAIVLLVLWYVFKKK